jgi:Spy/CpxP family protein refolding chaperone
MKKLFLLLLLTVGFAIPAFAQMSEMPRMEHRDRHERMMGMDDMGHMGDMGDMMGMCIKHAGELGLSDDQITKMNHVHRDMQKKQARFKADLKIAKIDLMEIMDVKDFDMEKAGAAVKKIEGIRTAHHMEMLKDMKEIRKYFDGRTVQKNENDIHENG